MIHGATSTKRAFQVFVDAAIARCKAPYAVDLGGRGDSKSLSGAFGMLEHAADMAMIIKGLGWR